MKRPTASLKFSTFFSPQTFDLVKSKLLGGQYHSMQHAFKVFSTQGNSSVTKCALYRILCNYVPGLTLHNFNLLIKRYILSYSDSVAFYATMPRYRIHVDQNKLVSFQEFFSKFHTPPNDEEGWQYPFARLERHPMYCRKSDTWQSVHSQLRENAQNGSVRVMSG